MKLRYLLWEAAVEKHCGNTDEKINKIININV